jgi:hypothetical protein
MEIARQQINKGGGKKITEEAVARNSATAAYAVLKCSLVV